MQLFQIALRKNCKNETPQMRIKRIKGIFKGKYHPIINLEKKIREIMLKISPFFYKGKFIKDNFKISKEIYKLNFYLIYSKEKKE